MSIKLTDNRILVEPDAVEEKTTGGIIIANPESKENTATGKVIDVGPGFTTKSGKIIPVGINAGESVLYMKNTGDSVTLDTKQYLIFKEDEILAVVND